MPGRATASGCGWNDVQGVVAEVIGRACWLDCWSGRWTAGRWAAGRQASRQAGRGDQYRYSWTVGQACRQAGRDRGSMQR